MQKASEENPGAMTAVLGLSLAEARDVCEVAGRGDVLAVANENGSKQVVLSGSMTAVERAEELARSRGGRTVRLPVAGRSLPSWNRPCSRSGRRCPGSTSEPPTSRSCPTRAEDRRPSRSCCATSWDGT